MMKWKIYSLWWLVASGFLCTAQNPDYSHWRRDEACMKWVDSVYGRLSMEERIGQFFMLPAYTSGKNYNMDTVLNLVKQGHAGGVIFFKGMPDAQAIWTNRLQDSAKVGCMIAIDGEWGLAMRLDSTISFPRQMTLGAIRDDRLIYEMGREIGRQCRRMGIHVNFAPDVDVNNNPNNPVINERSFGENKWKVAAKGVAYARGMQDEGILACAKHFPGHGDVTQDSHKELPLIQKGVLSIDSLELYPFKALINHEVGSVMVAHLNIPSLDGDSGSVASLSKKIATDLLKVTLGFDGLVFSDALNMKGVSKFYRPGTVDSIAFMAGNDILVFSEDAREGIRKIKMAVDSGKIPLLDFQMRVKKVLAYKYKMGLHMPQRVVTDKLLAELNDTPAKMLRQKLFEHAITIAANQDNLLPFREWKYKNVASLSIGNGGKSLFQNHVEQFAEMDFFYVPDNYNQKAYSSLADTLSKYELVIIDLHGMTRAAAKNYNVSEATRKFAEGLSGKTKVVMIVFGNPYSLQYFEYLPWVMTAYEDNDATQRAAANALFGAERVRGRLPVTASKNFPEGTGYDSDTIYRLKISLPEEVGIKSDRFNLMDEIIRSGIQNKAFPGCQLLVAKDGKVIWNKSYGTKNYDATGRVANTDLFDLASITKVAATTIAIMKLYDEDKIDLNKTVDDYLELPRHSTIRNLKLKDILTHQAGLKAFFAFYKQTTGAEFDRYYRSTPDGTYRVIVADSMYLRSDYPDSIWHIIATSDVDDHPRYVYSDNDFYILQKIVEKVSGMSLDKYANTNFYQPMGLTRIGFQPLNKFPRNRIAPTENDTLFRKRLVHGYVHDPGAAMYGGVAGHAGLFSNAFDLAALFQMLLNNGTYNGKRFLDSSTVRIFTARQSKISRRGYGFDKPEPDVSKSSPTYDEVPLSVFGHTGFTGTCVWSDPDHQLTYIFLSNRVNPDAENNMLVKMNIRTKLQEVVYKAIQK